MTRRVVVSGMGVISPVGNDLNTFWDSLKEGRSGIGPLTRFDASKFSCQIAGEVKDFQAEQYIERKEIRQMDRFIQFALAAACQAFDHSRLQVHSANPNRIGVLVGSGIGGIEQIEKQHLVLLNKGPRRISPFFIPSLIINMAAGRIAMRFGLKGPNSAISTACATGNHAIGDAFRIIQRDEADAMLAGGTESPITPTGFGGFCSMRAMCTTRNHEPTKASRPFDKLRNGFVMGEGAGVLVLEELEHCLQREGTPLAELAGYGLTSDAHHITAPAPGGEGAARAMDLALKNAGMDPGEVDYINAHGTSTPLNDKLETSAIKTVFGEHARTLSISSTKSVTGHLLGAAGAIEAVASIMAICHNTIPPTMNYEEPDPDCDLDYTPNVARQREVRVAMSNALGFGGTNATLIMRRYEK